MVFWYLWFGIRDNIWCYLICTQFPQFSLIITKGLWVYLAPHSTATYPKHSGWASTLCKVHSDQVFLRVSMLHKCSLSEVSRPIHKPTLLLSLCFLAQHAMVVSTSTTPSPANSVAATMEVPGTDFTAYCLVKDGSLCSFVPLPPKLQEPTPTSLISCGSLWQDGEEHLSLSLVLHFDKEAPKRGCLAPSTKLFPSLQ